jgi:hypothetical protein
MVTEELWVIKLIRSSENEGRALIVVWIVAVGKPMRMVSKTREQFLS